MIQSVTHRVRRYLGMFGAGALLAMTLLQVADAGYPPIYDVEIIVFMDSDHPGIDAQDAGGISSSPDDGRAFPEGEFTELGYKFYQLKKISESLEQSSEYNVLFHRAWRQVAYNSSRSVPYHLFSLANDDMKSVAGRVTLERDFDLELYLDIDVLLMNSESPVDESSMRPVQQLVEKLKIDGDRIYYFNHSHMKMVAKVTPYWKNGMESGRSQVAFIRQQLAINAVDVEQF